MTPKCDAALARMKGRARLWGAKGTGFRSFSLRDQLLS
jgi:hypothetical protein